jgi:hypothetical protein
VGAGGVEEHYATASAPELAGYPERLPHSFSSLGINALLRAVFAASRAEALEGPDRSHSPSCLRAAFIQLA